MSMYGVLAALGVAVSGSAKDLLSKRLAFSLSGTVSTFGSFLFAVPYYLVLLPILWIAGVEDFLTAPNFWTLIAIRALVDTGAEWSKMESLSRADISIAAAFLALSPAFLVPLSPVITGDPISSNGALGLIIISVGGILLARPQKGALRTQTTGILFGVLSAFCFALNHCVDRLTAQTGSAAYSGFAMTIVAALFMAPFALLRKRKENVAALRENTRPLLLRGILEVFGMVAKLLSLQYLTAPVSVAISRLSIPLSIACGSVLYKEPDLPRRLFLGTVIVVGCLLTLF